MSIVRGFFTGTTPIALSASGLPAGANFADNGNGSYTVFGTWPSVGSYPYSVTAVNSAGSVTVPGNALNSTSNGITLDSYVHVGQCAVASSPGSASFSWQMRPNGQIWSGTNTAGFSNTGQNWHDGTANAADYQVNFTLLSGAAPSFPALGVWHSLATPISISFDRALSGEDSNTVLVEIRRQSTGAIVGQNSFCQQVGVDVFCSPC
jgi:hypothetical protein